MLQDPQIKGTPVSIYCESSRASCVPAPLLTKLPSCALPEAFTSHTVLTTRALLFKLYVHFSGRGRKLEITFLDVKC